MQTIRRIAVAAAATAFTALALAVPAASANVHPRATTVCANNPVPCTDISNLGMDLGNSAQFIQNAVKGDGAGHKINLRQAADNRSNEDFIVRVVGTVGQLCPSEDNPVTGVNSLDPTSYACLVYNTTGGSGFPVFQAKFAPNSNVTGNCIGAISATDGFKARLERCGHPNTFWVADLAADVKVTLPGPTSAIVYFPIEFAMDTAASNPLVLTNVLNNNPTHQLTIHQENFSGGQVPNRQMFGVTVGSPILSF